MDYRSDFLKNLYLRAVRYKKFRLIWEFYIKNIVIVRFTSIVEICKRDGGQGKPAANNTYHYVLSIHKRLIREKFNAKFNKG